MQNSQSMPHIKRSSPQRGLQCCAIIYIPLGVIDINNFIDVVLWNLLLEFEVFIHNRGYDHGAKIMFSITLKLRSYQAQLLSALVWKEMLHPRLHLYCHTCHQICAHWALAVQRPFFCQLRDYKLPYPCSIMMISLRAWYFMLLGNKYILMFVYPLQICAKNHLYHTYL